MSFFVFVEKHYFSSTPFNDATNSCSVKIVHALHLPTSSTFQGRPPRLGFFGLCLQEQRATFDGSDRDDSAIHESDCDDSASRVSDRDDRKKFN